MTQYIDKDALVAEIEKKRDRIKKGIFSIPLTGRDRADATMEYEILEKIEDFLNTLEVKEVDLEEEARKWEDKVYLECGYQDAYGNPHAPFYTIGEAFIAGAEFMIKVQKGE